MENTLIPPGTVVVGIDGSPSSERALDWAVDLAVREGRQLTLAHGIDAAGIAWSDPMGGSHRAVIDAMAQDGRRLLAAARAQVAELAPDLAVHESSWLADPRVTLLELSEAAHTVVVGSRGRGPVKSLLLGSVGVALVRHALCPVVVLRPGRVEPDRAGVVVGADGRPDSRAVVEYAYRQASMRQLPLTILHCSWGELPGTTDEDVRLPVSEPLAGLAEKFPDVQAHLEVVQGMPDEELVQASKQMDLVVVGAHHGGRLTTLINGSVAQSVVEHAGCPVAVVR